MLFFSKEENNVPLGVMFSFEEHIFILIKNRLV
jgi:hypothetical protein